MSLNDINISLRVQIESGHYQMQIKWYFQGCQVILWHSVELEWNTPHGVRKQTTMIIDRDITRHAQGMVLTNLLILFYVIWNFSRKNVNSSHKKYGYISVNIGVMRNMIFNDFKEGNILFVTKPHYVMGNHSPAHLSWLNPLICTLRGKWKWCTAPVLGKRQVPWQL